MSGSAPRTVLLLLIGTLAAVAVLGPTAAIGAPAATPGCTWQRHSKTVSKHLRRHGQPRRVKRVKHWWTCEAQPSLLQQPGLPVEPAPAAPPGEPEPEVGHLGVKAVEYSYTLSRPEVNAGEVIVELNNQGEDPHNLVLEHEARQTPTWKSPQPLGHPGKRRAHPLPRHLPPLLQPLQTRGQRHGGDAGGDRR